MTNTLSTMMPGEPSPLAPTRLSPDTRRGPGFVRRWISRLFVLACLGGTIAAAFYYSPDLMGSAASEKGPSMSTHQVRRGDLLITVTEDGNVESAANVEVKCQVAGGSSILWIVPDGEMVKKGDKIVELDTAQLDEQINTQKITYEKARSAMIQAEKDFEVAKISVTEYLEGTYRKDLQTADSQITIAMENLRSAQNSLEHSQRMFRKGYVSSLELESQQFAVQRSQLDLDAAKTAKDVLERFTKVKSLEDLQSKRDTAEAKMKSEQAAFALEESKLKRLEDQRKNCIILAPQDGMVVYANEAGNRFGGQQAVQISEGAAVRERQTILRLPDLAKMQVKANVHESRVEQLRPGMRARIRILERELLGTVASVANQPEPGSWFSASVKEYATIVRIEGEPGGLKPGMTAEVEILVAHLQDVVNLPVATVVEQRGRFLCWVRKGEELERRPLVLGLSNDEFVEVKDGVQEGETIVLNPRAVVAEAQAVETDEESEKVDVNKKFGDAKGAGGPPGTQEKGAGAAPGSGGPSGPGQPGPGPSGARPAEAPGAGGPPGGRGGGGGAMNLAQFDKDGDGKISKDEAPEFLQRFFDRVDTNADGFLDADEQKAMRARSGGAGAGGGGRGNLMQFDKDGDGKVSKDEAPEFMQSFFDRLDSNSDGFVDSAEASAAQARFSGGGGAGGGPPGGGSPSGP